jgi:hypothetical protein
MQHEEIASIIISAVPCPPLPLAGATKEHRDELPFTVSSHDVLRLVILDTAYNKPAAMQQNYLRLKAEAEARLYAAIDALPAPVCPEEAYPLFCSYMRDVLAASPVVPGAVSIMPLGHVISGDAVHRAAVDHYRAQNALFGDDRVLTADVGYRALVGLYATRVFFAETPAQGISDVELMDF